MNINLTISADSAAELTTAVIALAASFKVSAFRAPDDTLIPGTRDPEVVTPAEKPKRGRPAKAAEPIEAPVADEPVQEVAPAAPAPAAAQYERKDVQKLLVAVVQKHGVAACSEICMTHGGPNLSALDPSTYPSVVAAAQAKLADAA